LLRQIQFQRQLKTTGASKRKTDKSGVIRRTGGFRLIAWQERRAVMISEIERRNETRETIFLDPEQKCPRAEDFAETLRARIVGQERAVGRMSSLYQVT